MQAGRGKGTYLLPGHMGGGYPPLEKMKGGG